MPQNRFAHYISSCRRKNTVVGDLARYIMDHNPKLFNEGKPAWDRFFSEETPPAPPNIKATYDSMVRMMTARSGKGAQRPAFAAYMWRYRRYTGPTTDLALLVESLHPELFSQDYDEWVRVLTPELPAWELDHLALAYRRSLRNPTDPLYARHINHRYTPKPDGSPPDGK